MPNKYVNRITYWGKLQIFSNSSLIENFTSWNPSNIPPLFILCLRKQMKSHCNKYYWKVFCYQSNTCVPSDKSPNSICYSCDKEFSLETCLVPVFSLSLVTVLSESLYTEDFGLNYVSLSLWVSKSRAEYLKIKSQDCSYHTIILLQRLREYAIDI